MLEEILAKGNNLSWNASKIEAGVVASPRVSTVSGIGVSHTTRTLLKQRQSAQNAEEDAWLQARAEASAMEEQRKSVEELQKAVENQSPGGFYSGYEMDDNKPPVVPNEYELLFATSKPVSKPQLSDSDDEPVARRSPDPEYYPNLDEEPLFISQPVSPEDLPQPPSPEDLPQPPSPEENVIAPSDDELDVELIEPLRLRSEVPQGVAIDSNAPLLPRPRFVFSK